MWITMPHAAAADAPIARTAPRVPVVKSPPTDPALRAALAEPGLHKRALIGGRFYGAAIDSHVLTADRAFMNAVADECGVITAETAFKWAALHPAANRYSWAQADQIMRYAERAGMQVRGHTLLWHEQNPRWLVDSLTPQNAERILDSHITTVCRRYRRRLTHWDVANEVLWPADKQPMGLRNSLWFRTLGPRMLDIAFHACAEADPGALRFINDFGLDYTWPDNEAKRQAMLTLLSDLKARGVPVQGLGMQAHLEAGVDSALNQKVLEKFCNDVASLGLQIAITELDIRDNRLPADPATRDAAVAAHGRAFLDAVLSCPAVIGVVSWGLSDRRTWLNDQMPRPDWMPQRPLPLDTELRRKKLWQSIAASLDAASKRA